jgi:hypothetical protein
MEERSIQNSCWYSQFISEFFTDDLSVHQAGKEDAVEPLKDSFFRNFYNEAYFQY